MIEMDTWLKDNPEARPDAAFDRGDRVVQDIRELFEFRNQVVHSPPRSAPSHIVSSAALVFKLTKTDPPTTPILAAG